MDFKVTSNFSLRLAAELARSALVYIDVSASRFLTLWSLYTRIRCGGGKALAFSE